MGVAGMRIVRARVSAMWRTVNHWRRVKQWLPLPRIPLPVIVPYREAPCRGIHPCRPLVSPHLPPFGMLLVKGTEPLYPADSKVAEREERQRREDGYDAGQASDRGYLAAQRPGADVPSLGPVRADVLVVRRC